MSLLVFGVLLVLYAASMGPALAPYRDSGEMVAAALTLSVAHPTSYPLYVLLGRLAEAFPLGNPAYRLNLLSAAAAAAACAVVFSWARRRWGAWAAAGAAALLALNASFWSVAQVQEMYALWMLQAAALSALALRLSEGYDSRLWRLFCLSFGFCLANRLDLLLWAPGLLWLALSPKEEDSSPLWASAAFLIVPAAQAGLSSNWPIVPLIAFTAWLRRPAGRGARWAAESAAWGAAGLSLYLFLPARSWSGPWLDWNHPSTVATFLDSLLRTRYGGTLDLLSKNYAMGELFGENARLYAKHLWESFSAPGLALAAAGCWTAARTSPRRWLGQAACYWWAGPVFLFLANMPPNPHAAAIVDPHYLLSDVILVFWAAEGLGALAGARAWAAALAAAALLAVPLASGRWQRFNRRGHFFNHDFADAALRGVPQGGVLAAKKDVQLYSLWSQQLGLGRRPDARVVAQGLAAAPWYQADWRRRDPSLALVSLAEADGWTRFAALNGGAVCASPDTEMPAALFSALKPRGLVSALGEKAQAAPAAAQLDVLRGDYRYEYQPDFFTSDLVESRAQALARAGAAAAVAGRKDEARRLLLSAWSMHWALPEPSMYLGYLEYAAGRLEEARRQYALSALIFDELLVMAREYRALPSVQDSLLSSSAQALVQLGVAHEKLGRREEALKSYEESLRRKPSAQAHYDIAALFWGRDWARVETELMNALRLEPTHAEAAKFLAQLRSRPK